MPKTPDQKMVIEAKVRAAVNQILTSDLDTLAKELQDEKYDGDCHMAALEIVGSVCATITAHLEKTIFSEGGAVIQTRAEA